MLPEELTSPEVVEALESWRASATDPKWLLRSMQTKGNEFCLMTVMSIEFCTACKSWPGAAAVGRRTGPQEQLRGIVSDISVIPLGPPKYPKIMAHTPSILGTKAVILGTLAGACVVSKAAFGVRIKKSPV